MFQISSNMGAYKDIKVVVCGQRGCGKTSILQLLVNGRTLDKNQPPTIEDVYFAKIIQFSGAASTERLRLYDCVGLSGGSAEFPDHLCFADAYVIVYSIESEQSFKFMEDMKRLIDDHKEKKDATVLVLGNKLDLGSRRAVDSHVAQAWAASEKVRLWEVTAMERSTLIEPFWYIATRNATTPRQSFSSMKKKR